MNNKLFKNKYFYTFLTVICSGAGLILIFLFVFANNVFMNFFSRVFSLLAPIIYGFVIAYIMNPVMNFIEAKIIGPIISALPFKLKDLTKKKVLRFISIFNTLILFALFIFLFFRMLVPEVISSVEAFSKAFPTYVENTQKWIDSILTNYPMVLDFFEKNVFKYSTEFQTYVTDKFLPETHNYLSSISSISQNLLSTVVGFIKGICNVIIGIVVSVYLLFRKEQFAAQSKKILYSIFPVNFANAVLHEVRFINTTFTGFFTGKILDSFIVGIVCFFVTTILNIPYALMVSLIIGVTNIIPVFGPIIGGVPSVLVILMVDPNSALVFTIFIIILQQIDGNILGPKVLGDSIGMPSFWVVFSILVFGDLYGMIGILVGVPAFAVFYDAIRRFTKWCLHKRGLPESTTPYTYLEYIEDGKLILMTDQKKEAAKEPVVISIKLDSEDKTKKENDEQDNSKDE